MISTEEKDIRMALGECKHGGDEESCPACADIRKKAWLAKKQEQHERSVHKQQSRLRKPKWRKDE
jgi:hypothetical protein